MVICLFHIEFYCGTNNLRYQNLKSRIVKKNPNQLDFYLTVTKKISCV